MIKTSLVTVPTGADSNATDTIATSRVLGRVTAGAGAVEALTGAQATTLLDAVTTSAKGVVPTAPNDTTKFLRGDATWAVPAGATASPQLIGAWTWDNVGVGGGGTRGNAFGAGSAVIKTVIPYAMDIRAISFQLNATRTAGSLVFHVEVGGAVLHADCKLTFDGSQGNTTAWVTFAAGLYQIAAGGELSVIEDAGSGTFAPTSGDGDLTVWGTAT